MSSEAQPTTEPRLRVAICGGGIAGLLLAIGLTKHDDIEVNVYEAAKSFEEIGAGVTIWARALAILTRMGLDHDMRVVEGVPTDGLHDPKFSFDLRRSDVEEGFLLHALRLPHTSIYFHRARFLDVLVKHVPVGVSHFGKRLTTYSQLESGVVSLEFADGTSATCDVLLGCDGIRSAVRKQLFENEAALRKDPGLLTLIEPVYSGSIAYRTLVPAGLLTSEDGVKHTAMCGPLVYCGRNKRIVTYPVAGGTMCNFVGIVTEDSPPGEQKQYDGPWMTECDAQEVVDCYATWEPQVKDLCKLIHPRKPLKWALHEVQKLPFSTSGNVALVGDAAHAMVPFQASGAAQAVEDAYILVGLLGHPSTTRETVPRALKVYEEVRLPMAQHVMEASRTSGRLSGLDPAYGTDYEKLGRDMERQWDWISGPDPLTELERAIRLCYPDDNSVRLA